jgi:hypothetical protein
MPTHRCVVIWWTWALGSLVFARDLEIHGVGLPGSCCAVSLALLTAWVAVVHIAAACWRRAWNAPAWRALALLVALVPLPWISSSWLSHWLFFLRSEAALEASRARGTKVPWAEWVVCGTDPGPRYVAPDRMSPESVAWGVTVDSIGDTQYVIVYEPAGECGRPGARRLSGHYWFYYWAS